MRKSARWERIGAIVSVVAIISGLVQINWQLSENRNIQRQVHAISYCDKYYFNQRIRELISYTYTVSKKIARNYPGLLDRNRSSADINALSEIIKNKLRDDEGRWYTDQSRSEKLDLIKFAELFNFFDYGMVGVIEKAFDKNIVQNCIAVQVVCFKEKYHYRIPIFEHANDSTNPMQRIDRFIRHAEIDFGICPLATDDLWLGDELTNHGAAGRYHRRRIMG